MCFGQDNSPNKTGNRKQDKSKVNNFNHGIICLLADVTIIIALRAIKVQALSLVEAQ